MYLKLDFYHGNSNIMPDFKKEVIFGNNQPIFPKNLKKSHFFRKKNQNQNQKKKILKNGRN